MVKKNRTLLMLVLDLIVECDRDYQLRRRRRRASINNPRSMTAARARAAELYERQQAAGG